MFGKKKTGDKKGKPRHEHATTIPDPLDDPELLAVIASDVAFLPPPSSSPAEEQKETVDSSGLTSQIRFDSFSQDDPKNTTSGLSETEVSSDSSAFTESEIPPNSEEETPVEAFADSKRSALLGLVTAVVVATAIGGGAWLFFDDSDRAVSPTETLTDKISMPMPPLQTGIQDSSSPEPRPWLTETPLSPKDNEPESHSPSTPRPTASPDPATIPPSTEQAQSTQTQSPEVTHSPASDTISSSSGSPSSGDKSAQTSVPALVDPPFPSLPQTTTSTPPRYSSLIEISKKPLSQAPRPELLRQTPLGALPVIGQDGTTPWQAYAKPFTPSPKTKGLTAIIISNLGLDPLATDAAISRLPPEVTLAFSPYAPNVSVLMQQARNAGHEVMLTIPLESSLFPAKDPGPLGLLTTIPESENLGRLENAMAKAGGYVGILTLSGDRFEASSPHMSMLEKALAERGLLLVTQEKTGSLVSGKNDTQKTITVTVSVQRDVFQEIVDTRLSYLGTVAQSLGYSVGVIDATPLTLTRLVNWIDTLSNTDIALAPVSALFTPPATSQMK